MSSPNQTNQWNFHYQVTNGFILCGHRIDGGHHGLLVKTDANGDIEWQRNIATFARDVIESKVGGVPDGYVVVGKNFIAKLNLDPFNGFVWQKSTGMDVNSVEQTSDEGYIVAGTESNIGIGMKIDVNGDWEWSSAPDPAGKISQAFTAAQVPGGYLIGGQYATGFDKSYLFKVDNNGDFIWTKLYEVPSLTTPKHFAIADIKYDDFGYILNTMYPAGIMRVKFNGDVTRNAGISSSLYDYNEVGSQTGMSGRNKFDFGHDDGIDGFVMADASVLNKLRVVKTNPKGRSGCDEIVRVVTAVDGNETYFAGAVSSPTTLNFGTTSLGLTSHSTGSSAACFANTCTELTPTITRNCNDGKRCIWECVTMDAGGGMSEYLWNNGVENRYNCSKSGTHKALVVDGNGCWGTDQFTITDAPSDPLIDAPDDYHVTTTIATNFPIWTPANNPFNNGTDEILFGKNLIIDPGVKIIVSGLTLRFANESRVIIERGATVSSPGAELKLVNSKLTNFDCCYNPRMWRGIQVLGYFTASQEGVNTPQGKLEVLGVSKISNARLAVATAKFETAKTDGRDSLTNNIEFDGGIIQATGTVFEDNGTDILMFPYANKDGSVWKSDRSRFVNCSFVGGVLIDASEDGFFDQREHVILGFVYTIQFRNCSFVNSNPGAFAIEDRGIGIRGFGAAFTVENGCLFKKLNYGILASTTSISGGLPVTVKGAEFDGNLRGIRLDGHDFATVTYNEFTISEPPPDTTYGLYLNGCSDYWVEGNDFTGPGNSNLDVGIVVNNSGPVANFIYRNEFVGLDVGTEALGENDDGDFPYTKFYHGLEFLCNTYDNNDFHITVMDGRISERQGKSGGRNWDLLNPDLILVLTEDQSPANNTLKPDCNDGSEVEFLVQNGTQSPFASFYNDAYFYRHQPDALRTPSCRTLPPPGPNGVELEVASGTFYSGLCSTCSCPEVVVDVCVGCKTGMIAFEDAGDKLESLIDGGNTNYLLNVINIGNSGQTRNALMAASPYLSDRVLIHAIKAGGLPPGVLSQILIANSSLSKEVLAELGSVFLPNGVKNQINNAQTGTLSARDELFEDMAFLKSRRQMKLSGVIRDIYNDRSRTITDRLQEVETLLHREEGHNRKEQEVAVIIAQEDFTRAQQAIAQYHPNGKDKVAEMMEIEIALKQKPDKHLALKKEPVLEQKVRAIATNPSSKANVYAKGLLSLAFKEQYRERVEIPLNTQNKMNPNYKEEESNELELLDENHKLRSFPNPFSDYTTIEAFVPQGITHAQVMVFNTLGVEIKRYKVAEGYNAVTVFKEDIPEAGVYIYALYGYGKLLERSRLILID